jgi:hypothetical protein
MKNEMSQVWFLLALLLWLVVAGIVEDMLRPSVPPNSPGVHLASHRVR